MESKFYGPSGQLKKDNSSFIVSSSAVHNVPHIRTEKLYVHEVIQTGPVEVLSGSSALSLDTIVSKIDSTGGVLALTLPDGTYDSQTKVIVQAAGANDVVLTPSTLLGGTTITTSDVGSSYTLQWWSGAWVLMATGPIGTGVVVA
jgi:hypothetical protein